MAKVRQPSLSSLSLVFLNISSRRWGKGGQREGERESGGKREGFGTFLSCLRCTRRGCAARHEQAFIGYSKRLLGGLPKLMIHALQQERDKQEK